MLAVRTFVFAVLTGNAGGGRTWRVVLVEDFLESGQCLGFEFDDVVKFLSFSALMALTSSAVVLRTRLAVLAVKGVAVLTWLAMP